LHFINALRFNALQPSVEGGTFFRENFKKALRSKLQLKKRSKTYLFTRNQLTLQRHKQPLTSYIMTLFDQISEDIKQAMKAHDKVRLETLRNIKKVFLEAKTAPGANDTLEDADGLKIISKLAKQGKETAATYTQAGRQDLADAELAQVEVLESYLPKQLTKEEIEAEVKKIIAQVGATSMKEMGKVMGTASKLLAGKADGRMISEVVKQLLA